MENIYFYLKALKAFHIIFIVTWFAGLFYIVRLFIYQTEANNKQEPERSILIEQFKIMSRRLWYGITWPSAVLTIILGFWLVYEMNYWLKSFMLLKFGFVAALLLYHLLCGNLYSKMQRDVYKYNSLELRIWNEVATVLLFAIVFIIIFKDTISWIWGIGGLAILTLVLMLAIRIYKKKREKLNP
jgi:putative membrane protein